jgi:flavorubredoxin
MSKIIVIYDSKTGFTEKMANAVVKGIKEIEEEVELIKVGTSFSVSKLDDTEAIILGSPTIYGSISREMRAFLESVKESKETDMLKLKNKKGGVFGSYSWDGGWIIRKLKSEMEVLGIKIVAPEVSLVNPMTGTSVKIDEKDLKKCNDLGKTVAKSI